MRRKPSHAAGIGIVIQIGVAGILIEEPNGHGFVRGIGLLVVQRRLHRLNRPAVAQGEEHQLAPLQTLLDLDPLPGFPKEPGAHHNAINGRVGLFHCGADNGSLSCRQAVCLDHQALAGVFGAVLHGILLCRIGVVEVLAERHWNPQTFEKVFSRALAILQYCRLSMRAQDSLPFFLKYIDDTIGQITLRPNKSQVYFHQFCKRKQFRDRLWHRALHRCQTALLHHLAACVTWSNIYGFNCLAPGKGMSYSISSATCVHHQNSLAGHQIPLKKMTLDKHICTALLDCQEAVFPIG